MRISYNRLNLAILTILVVALITASALVGCGKKGGTKNTPSDINNTITDPTTNQNTDPTTTPPTPPTSNATMDTSGGSVEIADPNSSLNGARVVVPQGAIESSADISINDVGSPEVFSYASTTNKVIELLPDGARFDVPVTVTVPYSAEGVADESNLRAYSYNSADKYWEELHLENIDTVNKQVTARTTHFCQLTTQEALNYFDWSLYKYSDDTLAARITLKKSFFDKQLSIFDQLTQAICNTYTVDGCGTPIYTYRDLLYYYDGYVRFRYEVSLMEKNTFFDTTIATKTISFTEHTIGGRAYDTYDVEAFDVVGANKTTMIRNGNLKWDGFIDWYSGNPVVFRFGAEPESGKKYYLKFKFMVIQNDTVYDRTTFEYKDTASATSDFASIEDVDANHNGVVDVYEPNQGDSTPPSVPTNLRVMATTPTSISLAWNSSPESDTAGYRLYRDESPKNFFHGPYNTARDTGDDDKGLIPNKQYCYQVSAYDLYNESNKSAKLCAATTLDTAAPAAPTGLTATAPTANSITLAWSPSTDNVGVKGYYIYQEGAVNPRNSATGTSLTLDKLAAATQFCYQVSAFDASGNVSSKSPRACASTPAATAATGPSVPDGVAATFPKPSLLKLSWNPSSAAGGIKNYQVCNGNVFLSGGFSGQCKWVDSTYDYTYYSAQSSGECFRVRAVDNAGKVSEYSQLLCVIDRPVVYGIGGWIFSDGLPVSGITVVLSGDKAASGRTNLIGYYDISDLPAGSYTLTPSHSDYTFTPVSRTVTISSAWVKGQDFTATPVPRTYSISGTVTSDGAALSGVTVSISGASSTSTTTDASGNFSFSGLQNGSYTLTANKDGYNISPSGIPVTISGANATGQNFTATPIVTTYSLSGRITLGGSGLPGVTVSLTGAATKSATTDANGEYSFTGLANGVYTITPTLANYSFDPASRSVTVSGTDISGKDFTATGYGSVIIHF